MASSVEEYASKDIAVTTGSSTDTAVLGASATGAIDASSSTKTWIISGASNVDVSVIATGSGSDNISLTAATDVAINVGTGSDTVQLGGGAGTTVENVVIVGGDGSKVVGIDGDLDPSIISLTGSGNQTATVSGALLDSTIVTGAGRDTITVGSANKGSIVAGAGNDSVVVGGDVDTTYIDLGAGRDSLSITGAVKDSTIVGGDGVDYITLDTTASASSISLGAGKDTLEVGGAIVDTSIYGGADADVVSLSGATYSYVDLGAGADEISLSGNYGDTSIQGGAGKDTYYDAGMVAGSTVSITDYDVVNDVLVGTPAANPLGANGNVSLSSTAVVNVSKTGDYYAVQYATAPGGTTNYVAWGDEDGSTINISSWNKATTVNGNVNDAADLILGGTKADTIIAGAEDSVYGGAGNDTISIAASTATTQEYVGLASAGGKDSVGGFQAIVSGTAASDEADVLYLYENNIASLKLESVAGGLQAKVGTGSVQLNGLAATAADRINVKDNSGKTYEVEFVGGTDSITSAVDDLADFYYAGTQTASLDFSSVSDALVVDLGNRGLNLNGTSLTNTDSAFYYGDFASVTGGAESTVLLGSASAKETLIAGAGDTTLWGGGEKADYMEHVGITNTAVFVFGNGDGKDSIASTNWDASSDEADILWLNTTSVSAVKNNGTNTTVTLQDGSKATLVGYGSSASDTAMKVSFDGVNATEVKIGVSGTSNTWTYDEDVSIYLGGSKNTLKVTNSVDTANVWLDGGQGVAYDNVTTVDASSNSGTVILAGGANNETLIAGTGSSSLWGGGAGNDVLQGNSAGNTTFYFGNGNGNDVITASNTDDKVVLYNAAITDVKAVDDSKSGVLTITLNDGSSLTVNNTTTSVNTFQLADGSTWKRDSSTGAWSQA